MRLQSLQFLKKLLKTPSPVGHEGRGQRVWLDYVEAFADETFSDAYGNTVAVLNKGGSPRVMLAGHADEIAALLEFVLIHGTYFVGSFIVADGGTDAAMRPNDWPIPIPHQ